MGPRAIGVEPDGVSGPLLGGEVEGLHATIMGKSTVLWGLFIGVEEVEGVVLVTLPLRSVL